MWSASDSFNIKSKLAVLTEMRKFRYCTSSDILSEILFQLFDCLNNTEQSISQALQNMIVCIFPSRFNKIIQKQERNKPKQPYIGRKNSNTKD